VGPGPGFTQSCLPLGPESLHTISVSIWLIHSQLGTQAGSALMTQKSLLLCIPPDPGHEGLNPAYPFSVASPQTSVGLRLSLSTDVVVPMTYLDGVQGLGLQLLGASGRQSLNQHHSEHPGQGALALPCLQH
jgi:hypothetical protein